MRELLLGIIALLTIAIGAFVYSSSRTVLSEEQVLDEELIGTDSFEKGQYYFNADDNPSGPYDLARARVYYEAAIAASSTEHSLVWYQLGRIHFIEGRFDAAIHHFMRQIELFGDEHPQVRYMLGLTYAYRAQVSGSARDWMHAEEEFLVFLEGKPESPWARTDLAWIYFSQGKYDDMRPLLEAGLVYEPTNPWLLNMYGLALMNTGDREGAHAIFLEAEAYAGMLTVEEWGRAYPGNNPATWEIGLNSFREAIAKNLALTASSDES